MNLIALSFNYFLVKAAKFSPYFFIRSLGKTPKLIKLPVFRVIYFIQLHKFTQWYATTTFNSLTQKYFFGLMVISPPFLATVATNL